MAYLNVQINDAKFIKFMLMNVLLSRVPMVYKLENSLKNYLLDC